MEKEQKKNDVTSINRKEYRLRQKVLVFLFFLVLSTIFWLLNTLDHNFSANITFPIRYILLRPDREMVGNIPEEITVNVSGQGYALLRGILTSSQHPIIFRMITLDLNNVPGDSGKLYLLTNNLKDNIQRQINTEFTLNYISPDTLFYAFSPIVRKKVSIEPDIDIEFEKQFMQGGSIVAMPDSIVITGPESTLDTIDHVYTEYKKYTRTNRTFSEELKLLPIDNVSFTKKIVVISVPVEKFTESSINVPIKIINIPDSMEMKLFPTFIKVNYIVALDNYNKVSVWNFRATVDYNMAHSSINNKLKVTLERQPAIIRSVSFRPKNVDYIIVK